MDNINYFENIFQSIPSALIALDRNGYITHFNCAAEKIAGTPAENAVSRKIWEVIPFLTGYKSDMETIISSGDSGEIRTITDHIGANKTVYFNLTAHPLVMKGEKHGLIVRIDDVTDRVKKDEHLRRAQKMDMVGTLAAGLAHDFNNVINGIKATVSSVKYFISNPKIPADVLCEQLKDDLEIIEESAERGSGIVEQLLSLSRKKELPVSPVDLNVMVAETVKICRNTFPKNIEIKTVFPCEKAIISAYPTQIEQAILNLLINASHAMTIMKKEDGEKGGTVTVSVGKMYVGKNMCAIIPEAKVGNYWLLSICDQGVGMTEEVLLKIFDPFFTTKEKEKGSGLGLAMVYGIVREHNGFIDVYSEPGNGSTFFIFFPVYDGDKVES